MPVVLLNVSESDFRRPSGNLTGIMPYVRGLPAKQLEIAQEIVPGAQKIGIVNDTSDIKAAGQWDEINAAAAKFEIKIVMADARRPEDVEPAFRNFKAERVDVVIVLQANFLILDRANIAAAATATRQLSFPPGSNSSSTSKPRRCSASPSHPRCSRAPPR